MSKYDKSIAISHEEEGTYHRREVDCRPRSPVTTTTTTSYPVTTRYIERYDSGSKPASRQAAKQRAGDTSDSDGDNFQEWTTSKRKVNHKTRQVETRVSRQLLVRGGEVIADSGPQVTTRIKEDNKVEECEKEKTPKNKSRFEALENAPEAAEASGLVLGEKKEVQRVSREVREENMQYHDERFKELTGKDVHRRAIQAPHELITINDQAHSAASKPRGKMIHYSNKGKKYQDTDEILEVAKLAIDGSVTKEVKRTKHHEEFSEDELPDEKGEAEQLRHKPVVERSSRRHADYVNDFDEADAPADYSHALARYDSDAGSPVRSRKAYTSSSSKPRRTKEDEEAFPRYQIDPLLNSLRDEDFRPVSSSSSHSRPASRPKEHSIERNGAGRRSHLAATSSSDEEEATARRPSRQRGRSPSPAGRVEVPEEYRVNKQRLMSGKSGAGSTLSHKSNRSQQQQQRAGSRRREDAGTQARLTDEEVERQSVRSHSPPSVHSHEKAARYLQRQSTPNSSRRYYYGDSQRQKQQAAARKRPTSLCSSSSGSSLSSELDERSRRKQGVQSRDSGFKSPQSNRSETPIYSKSSKHRSDERPGALSPTGSMGQRSVKTTTTTLSAGLADRPLSRQDKEGRKSEVRGKSRASDKHDDQRFKRRQRRGSTSGEKENEDEHEGDKRSVITITNSRPAAYDTISLSSLQSPNATKIKVPYQQIIEIERERASNQRGSRATRAGEKASEKTSSSEMSFQEDIESLSRRLASISENHSNKQHFDYKTIVANLDAMPARPQMIGSYNVKIQQQNSPFRSSHEQQTSKVGPAQSTTAIDINNTHSTPLDNNNEPNFNPDHYTKYRATPVLVDQSSQLSADDDDRMSQGSSCSLQSARTYNIRKLESGEKTNAAQLANQSTDLQENCPPGPLEEQQPSAKTEVQFDENGNGKPTAWIFDPRDNSSTAIVAPARPVRPETPKVDAKTEELEQRRGGRSYYLELVEPEAEKTSKRRPRPSSIDSLYSRWNSHGALHRPLSSVNSTRPTVPRKTTNTTSQTALDGGNNEKRPTGKGQNKTRRQLPFSGPPSSLGDRSKSSSCLLSVTKPSKYSIYGGFRKPGEGSKPVPRLSYSRAIGPRSSRVDTTPTAPSRYLKMR